MRRVGTIDHSAATFWPMRNLIDELRWRGLCYQCTDEAGLRKHLETGVRRGYVGFDPTADSLTIGNMVTIMLLAHLQRSGHQPVVVSGGGTGLIGDPSGKSAERQLLTEEKARANVESQKRIFAKLLDLETKKNPALIVNNIDWLGKLGYIEALRDIGKHFSVNMMIQKDSVRERLNARDQGISYTEFSYMILQAYDFLHLFEKMGVTLQMGGSDQWGNIVAGTDLIKSIGLDVLNDAGSLFEISEKVHQEGDADTAQRIHDEAVQAADRFNKAGGWTPAREGDVRSRWEGFGLTAPLVTKADGGKFGKSESGAIWMTADRTSPYAFYQFWLNASDDDVPRFLKIFTFLEESRVNELLEVHAREPGAREAHRALARHVTELLHGKTEADAAEAAAKALFSGEVAALQLATLEEVFAEVPSSEHPRASLEGEGVPLLDLLPQTTLAKSKGEARQHLKEGSVTVNGRKAAPESRVTTRDLLHGQVIALRRGKKTWHITRWS